MDKEIVGEEIYVGRSSFQGAGGIHGDAAAIGGAEANHQALQSIVNNLVKLPQGDAPPKLPKIARITHHEISAMRNTLSNMPAPNLEHRARASMLIQSFDAFMGLFKPQERRSRCLVDGHECRHCGQTVRTEVAKVPEATRGH